MSAGKPSDQQNLSVPVIPPDETSSVRKRVQTEEGRAHEIDLLAKQLNACYKRLKRQCSLFGELLLSDDVDMVHTECTNLDRLLSEAKSIHDRVLTLSDCSEHTALLNSHEEIEGMVFSIKQQACSWLKSQDAGSRSRKSSAQDRRSRHSGSQAACSKTVPVFPDEEEKDQAYELDLLAKQLNACYNRLKRQCNLFSELLLSDDVNMVHTECANLDRLLSEAQSIHDRLLTLSDISARELSSRVTRRSMVWFSPSSSKHAAGSSPRKLVQGVEGQALKVVEVYTQVHKPVRREIAPPLNARLMPRIVSLELSACRKSRRKLKN